MSLSSFIRRIIPESKAEVMGRQACADLTPPLLRRSPAALCRWTQLSVGGRGNLSVPQPGVHLREARDCLFSHASGTQLD